MAAHDEVAVHYPSDVDVTDIRDILGGFVSQRAINDATIGEDRSSILASCIEEESTPESTNCKEVGQILVGIAEEIDHAHGNNSSIQRLMEWIGTPRLAFRAFQSVAKRLFSWDSSGAQVGKPGMNLSTSLIDKCHRFLVKVTWHRIAALLGFCYNLCRQFLLTVDNNQRAMKAFFTAVVGYLARFLYEGQLLNWIRSQGGWVS